MYKPRLGEFFFYSAEAPRNTDKLRPQIQLFARAITESLMYGEPKQASFRDSLPPPPPPPPGDEEPNAAWPGPGKGVSGETGN
jgi:hypothetical protein